MSRLLTLALASLIIASSAYAQASKSAYRPTHWDPLGRALDEFKDTDGWIKEKTDLYKRWENEGKLYVIDADAPAPRIYVFMANINRVIRGLVWLYQGALDEGLLPDDEQMKLAREVYAKLSTAMAPYGYWFPRGITDAPLPQVEEQNLLSARDLAFKAMAFAKAGNTGIAAEYSAQGDNELSELAEESKQDEDLGKKHTTWKIAEHAYFKAALKEIERLKALAEPEMTKAKNAKDQAKLNQQNEAARLKDLQEQAKKDWAELEAVYKDTADAVKDIGGDVSWSNAETYLPKLTEYESKASQRIQKALDAFTSKYGKREDAIKKIYEFKGDAFSDAELSHLDNVLRDMADALALPAKQRKDVAESLLREANSRINLADNSNRQKAFAEAAKLLQLATQFDPANEEVKKKLAGIGGEAAAADAALKKQIEARTWPGHIANFEGPGTVAELAESIRTYLTKHEEVMRFVNLRGQPAAVAIRGQWHSLQKNLLNQTTQWGLNALVAYVPDPAKDEAMCTDITIKTADEADVKKAPPWNEVAAETPYVMRASKLPGRSAAGASGSWGMANWLLWLLLGLGNVVAGALAAESLLKAKLPPTIQAAIAKAQTMRAGIGAVALVLGLLCLVLSLAALRPLSGLLPELSALAVGLMLMRPILAARVSLAEAGAAAQSPAAQAVPPADSASATSGAPAAQTASAAPGAAPAQPGFALKALRVLAAQATRLEAIQKPLGLAAVALGLLHLIIGWRLPLL